MSIGIGVGVHCVVWSGCFIHGHHRIITIDPDPTRRPAILPLVAD